MAVAREKYGAEDPRYLVLTGALSGLKRGGLGNSLEDDGPGNETIDKTPREEKPVAD